MLSEVTERIPPALSYMYGSIYMLAISLCFQVPPFLQVPSEESNSTNEKAADETTAEDGGGAAQHEGYIVDLLDEITSHLCVSYEISLVGDDKFGSKQGENWNGIIGEVASEVSIFSWSF